MPPASHRMCLFVLMLLILFPVKGFAETLRVGVISESANNWPLLVAEEKGYFSQEGLQVEMIVREDSGRQLEGLAQGTYHIAQKAADPFSWAVEQGKDLFVLMTISRPIFDFVVNRAIRSIGDLKGKTIALDRPTTGYWLFFRKVFAENGLPPQDLPGSYDTFVGSGLVHSVALSRDGFQQVLDLMAASGQLTPPFAPMAKYADPSYQQKALEGLKIP